VIKLVECPRDAMQGIRVQIPTQKKVEWMKVLLNCGFDTLDCGSFVNPSAVPQMADTATVIEQISDLKLAGNTKLLVIAANERGAVRASAFSAIDAIGYPFSVNETFQRRNTNCDRKNAFITLQKIHQIAEAAGKHTVAYISMAFGNPYGDEYNRDEVLNWANQIAETGIKTISLADTVGTANAEDIATIFSTLTSALPQIEWGAHFHSLPGQWRLKVETAYQSGCQRFDGAILGFGGCPFAKDKLTGNVPTEEMVKWFNERDKTGIDEKLLHSAVSIASAVYGEVIG
jgi:hydroxymethylglutaryl-CoA lyase